MPLKQASHRDEVTSSGPHETTDSFSHSFPHFRHLTRNFLKLFKMLRSGFVTSQEVGHLKALPNKYSHSL